MTDVTVWQKRIDDLEAELHLADCEINHLRAELHEHHLVRDPRCDLCAGEVTR